MATLARTHLGSPRLAQAHRGGPGRAPRAALWDRRNTTVNAATSQIGVAVVAAGGVRVQTSGRAGASASMSDKDGRPAFSLYVCMYMITYK